METFKIVLRLVSFLTFTLFAYWSNAAYLNASKPSDQSIGLDRIIGYSSAIGQTFVVYLVYILKRRS